MTLNISLLSRNVMAQSSDLRLTDPNTGALVEDESPKQVDITYFIWQAVIGYSGVAELEGQRTHMWLVNMLAHPMDMKEPQLTDIVERIRHRASKALAAVLQKYRRHTFVILAFVDKKPIAYMISNYQRFDAPDISAPANELFVSTYRPGRPSVMLAGIGKAVTRADKRLLKSLIRNGAGDDAIGKTLAFVNRRASKRSESQGLVSTGCVTHVLHADGTGGYVARAEIREAFSPQSLFLGLNTPKLIASLIAKGSILVLTPSARVERSTADGNWTNEAGLTMPRMDHTATLLRNGEVLVTGGRNGMIIHTSAELYSPESRVWVQVGSMANKRHGHRATQLLDGSVLVTGGIDTDLRSCEIYNPLTRQWSAANSLNVGRYNHISILLPSRYVLVAGGLGEEGALADVELYDPASDTWVNIDTLKIARRDHTAIVLLDGTVLVAGGMDNSNALLREVEVFDPRTREWSLITSMKYPHSSHTATLLGNGNVLIVGTRGQQTAELYDPILRSWKETCSLSVERQSGHAATSLKDGSVLISGGQAPENSFLATTERYIHEQDRWEFFGTLPIDRTVHTATLLNDGTVLIIGGGTAYGA